jgi:hypothetical protein
MAILAVINSTTDKLVSIIVAELTDYCPEGCYFVELPPDHIWVDGKIVSITTIIQPKTQLEVF